MTTSRNNLFSMCIFNVFETLKILVKKEIQPLKNGINHANITNKKIRLFVTLLVNYGILLLTGKTLRLLSTGLGNFVN